MSGRQRSAQKFLEAAAEGMERLGREDSASVAIESNYGRSLHQIKDCKEHRERERESPIQWIIYDIPYLKSSQIISNLDACLQ